MDENDDSASSATGTDAAGVTRAVGWYQDLAQPREHRYWDGSSWTDWTDLPGALPPTLAGSPRVPVPRERGHGRVPRPRDGSEVDHPLVGSFTWDTASDALEWSTQNYVVHGYEPGQVAADVPLMLRHKLPADRRRTERIMDRCRASGGSFSLHHRIVDAHDRVRVVVTVAVESVPLEPSDRRIYRGHVADVTDPATRDANRAVVASRVSSAAIQQSLAVLEMLLDLPEDGAMTILRRYSSHHNVKLSTLAHHVMIGTRLAWFRDEAKDAAAARRLLAWAVEQRVR